jgi:hypothetical protein
VGRDRELALLHAHARVLVEALQLPRLQMVGLRRG